MPFPFPLVPGSHADTSIIKNASDPSNMPLAGSRSIPQVSGPGLCCSCFGRSWATMQKSVELWKLHLKSSPGGSDCDRQAAPTPAQMWGALWRCEGVCVGGESGRGGNTKATEASDSAFEVALTWVQHRFCVSVEQRPGTPDVRKQPGSRAQEGDSVKCWSLLSSLGFQNSGS